MSQITDWISGHKTETIGIVVVGGLGLLLLRGGAKSPTQSSTAVMGYDPNALQAMTQLQLAQMSASVQNNHDQIALQAEEDNTAASLTAALAQYKLAGDLGTLQAQVQNNANTIAGNVSTVISNNQLAASESSNATTLAMKRSDNQVLTTGITSQQKVYSDMFKANADMHASDNATAAAIQQINAGYLTTVSNNTTAVQLNNTNQSADTARFIADKQAGVYNNEIATGGVVSQSEIDAQKALAIAGLNLIQSGALNKGGQGGASGVAAFGAIYGQAAPIAGPAFHSADVSSSNMWGFFNNLTNAAAGAYSYA